MSEATSQSPPALPREITGQSRVAAAALDLRRLGAVTATCIGMLGLGGARKRTTRGERIRRGFEQLGLTYLKLGQFLAMRFDLLPRDVCEELEKLYERVQPVGYDEVRALVASEFGAPLEELYREFDPTPLASASVAQVHRAVTRDGRRVAVKIQRPGIERTFAADMRNLWRVARFVDRIGILGRLSARELAGEFITWTAGELDFVREAHTAERVRANALPYELVPELHWDLISRRVLTMELVDGLSLNEVTKLLEEGGDALVEERLPGLDLELTLHRFATASLRQLFVTGFFHGDPHPGNVMVRADNTVVFIDFGIFGQLDAYHRELMLAMIEGIAVGDVDKAFRSYAAMADATEDTDVAAFETAAKQVLGQWYASVVGDAPAEDRHLGRYVSEVLELVRRHHVRMTWDTLLFWRTLHALDTSGLKFPDHFALLEELQGFFTENGGTPGERLTRVLADADRRLAMLRLRRELPSHVGGLRATADGQLPWRPDIDEHDAERRRRDRAAKAFTAATLAGSSGLLAVSPGAGPELQVAMAGLASLLVVTSLREAYR